MDDIVYHLVSSHFPFSMRDHASRSDQPFHRMGKDALCKVADLVGSPTAILRTSLLSRRR